MEHKAVADGWPTEPLGHGENPFVRYRKLSHTWHQAMAAGMSDSEFVQQTNDLAARLAAVDETKLSVTPLRYSEELSTYIKNETVNVSGSHKARHLIGTALHLQIVEALGRAPIDTPLAIASCGNAALAAAVVAKAAGRFLRVFIPPSAPPAVVARLDALGAERIVCERREDDLPGDPCYLRFSEAVAAGALPFSCQGGDNALALVGGHTLGWEVIEQTSAAPASDVFVQVGGGALASSILQAFLMAKDAGVIKTLPTFHAVQTKNAHPLVRAWKKLQETGSSLDSARSHRSQFMWPWESEPTSVAGGILDDETYDWLSIVTGLVASHGDAIAVSEDRLRQAQHIAQGKTGIAVDATGTSGFAGLLQVRASQKISKETRPLVLFTGAIR